MKAIRIKHGSVAATFSLNELKRFGYCGGKPSREVVYALAEYAFSEIREHPRKISTEVYLSDTSLLLFAEEKPDTFRILN